MIEAISELTVGELVIYIALFLAGAAAVIEKTSKTMKPLTKLARSIGRAINSEVMEEVKQLKQDLQNEVKQVKQDLQDMKETEDERNAKAARSRVLRFGDELTHDVHHSKEHFDDVLRDITDYKNYCDTHPNFENDQMHETAEYVKSTYRECLKNHSFKY